MKHIAIFLVLVTGCSANAAATPAAAPQAAAPAKTPPAAAAPTGSEPIRFDFETGDLQGWKVFDGRFGRLVADRKMFRNQKNRHLKWNKHGKCFLSTNELPDGGFDDGMTGVVESPVFVLGAPKVTFLVGGGSHPNTYVALCTADGAEVLRARGISEEIMQRVTWNAEALVGRKVFVKVVDTNSGPWGHVTFDDFQAAGRIDPKATAERRANRAALEAGRAARQRALATDAAGRRDAEKGKRLRALMDPRRLFDRGQTRVYRGKHLGAISMPLGGNGVGNIQINGKAERHIWQIFNNMDQVRIPHSFFAVRIGAGGAKPVVRAMQTSAAGPFAAMKSLSFRGEYPLGWFDFEDPALPVRVSMEAFSPLIPLDAKSSAVPCAIFNMTAENTSDKPAEVSFLAAQQNAVGYFSAPTPRGKAIRDSVIDGRKFAQYGGNRNEILPHPGGATLHMTAELAKDNPARGDMALVALGGEVSGTASWSATAALAGDFGNDGKLTGGGKAGPSPAGQTLDGALAAGFTLQPGQKKTVTFVLTWHFPGGGHGAGRWGGPGVMYANWWPGALEVAKWLTQNLPDLSAGTRLYRDSLYESNLPVWLLDRISSQAAVLRSQTCFWTKSGYFGGWEGCNRASGCCMGNCAHVWHYAQLHAHLFPEIGRLMREQELAHQKGDGGIPFRQSSPRVAFDGTCGTVLGAYREHRLSADGAWLKKHWPRVRKAMDFLIATWDADRDGVLAGAQHNTLDGELGGSTTWLGGLYLAALGASEKMALLQGQAQPAKRYRQIRLSGEKKQDATLWNGEYYIQLPDARRRQDYNNGCAIDQMLGQWWAHELDLGWLYPRGRVRTALRSLLKYNFRVDFRGVPQRPRKFVADEDAGLQMICWPKGDRPPNHIRYADEVMSGFEYSAAAAMVQAGLLEEAFTIVRAARDRYDGRLRGQLAGDLRGGRSAWGYSGNPFGDDECGKFYARPMSIWSMLTACQGFIYDGPAGVIGFLPVWRPEDHRSFFTGAEGWGVFTQKREGNRQTERIEVRRGRLKVASLVFAAPAGTEAAEVAVTAAGKAIEAKHANGNGRVTISPAKTVTLEAGQALTVEIITTTAPKAKPAPSSAVYDAERLLARGRPKTYEGANLTAISMPLGGIGGGNVQIDGAGRRNVWQIFNNFQPVTIPHSFFAVRAAAGSAKGVVRAMQTSPVGPLPAMKSLSFRGEYPFGWFDFADAALPVRVSMEAFSPLIPMDAKSSALPCAVFSLTAENTSDKPADVSFLAAQQNAVGFTPPRSSGQWAEARGSGIDGRKHAGYGENRNAIVQAGGATVLHMTSDAGGKAPGSGDMALAVRGGAVTAVASWDTLAALAADFADDGRLTGPGAAGPTPAGLTVDGALAAAVKLAPGEKKTVHFLLTWHFPHGRSGSARRGKAPPGQQSWVHPGAMYANWWSDALDAARHLNRNLDELTRLTRAYHDALYETNLPVYMLDRISSQIACLKSQTCFWAKDGYFGGWEGCRPGEGCCPGNCSHVWHYAQGHARLFPEIGRRMRVQSLSYQNSGGGIPMRHPSGKVAFDGQCGEVLAAYREHLCSADGKWLEKHWPRIRKAMDYVVATWDKDEDGVPKGQQHNTLDAELSGSTSWLGGLYLAALAASEKMALLRGQGDLAARYRRIRLAGGVRQDETLFDGEYYIQVPDQRAGKVPGENYLTGCHIDQLLGQWWAHRLDLGWLYPPGHVRTALGSLFKYNFRTSFAGVKTYTAGHPARGQPRKFVHNTDHALMMTTWPKGGRPPKGKALRFANEVMTGFEYSAAGAMVTSGMLPEAFTIVRAAADRYDGRLRTGLTDRAWGYSGNPFGDDECGKFYARPLSIWSMLTACQGFIYDGPAGVIGFLPVWKPEDHRSFFTGAEGWGVFTQKREGKKQTGRIELRYGKLTVAKLIFAPAGAVSDVTVTAAGKKVKATHKLEDGRLTVSLAKGVTVEAGQSIEVVIE